MTTSQHAEDEPLSLESNTSASTLQQDNTSRQDSERPTELLNTSGSADVKVHQDKASTRNTKLCDHEGVMRPRAQDVRRARERALHRAKSRAKYHFESDSEGEENIINADLGMHLNAVPAW